MSETSICVCFRKLLIDFLSLSKKYKTFASLCFLSSNWQGALYRKRTSWTFLRVWKTWCRLFFFYIPSDSLDHHRTFLWNTTATVLLVRSSVYFRRYHTFCTHSLENQCFVGCCQLLFNLPYITTLFHVSLKLFLDFCDFIKNIFCRSKLWITTRKKSCRKAGRNASVALPVSRTTSIFTRKNPSGMCLPRKPLQRIMKRFAARICW